MQLHMASDSAAAYKSNSQRARVVTEAWGTDNLYCPNCSSPKLDRLSHNTRASDFCCPKCRFWYQLKGQQSRIGNSIPDGAYTAMMNAIRNDETPNFYFMHYEIAGRDGRAAPSAPQAGEIPAALPPGTSQRDVPTRETWFVRNLLLIPHFAFPPSAVIKRKPLAVTARRAGWVGCNIALHRIPADARIEIIKTCSSGRESAPSSSGNQSRLTSAATIVTPAEEVRDRFKRIKPLGEIKAKERGWTLDVLNAVAALCERRRSDGHRPPLQSEKEFTTADVYAFERELEKLHPDNRHVRDKIRQQLQVLRDMKLLIHVERGVWRLP
jgi:type II restriction enzyme